MIEVVEYIDGKGKNHFARWLSKLDNKAFARVMATVARMEEGNLGDVKPVGSGVSESRIQTGPGYRVYFGRDGLKLVILLGGGTKRTQQRDIQKSSGELDRIQGKQAKELTMPTRPFNESVRQRAAKDPSIKAAILQEAAECFLNGEVSVAKSMLAQYVKANAWLCRSGTSTW